MRQHKTRHLVGAVASSAAGLVMLLGVNVSPVGAEDAATTSRAVATSTGEAVASQPADDDVRVQGYEGWFPAWGQCNAFGWDDWTCIFDFITLGYELYAW
jgi:hypothetical protein